MSFSDWLALTSICILGALSPGASLALIIRNTLAFGTATGLRTALGHGLGVGFYALISATGVKVIFDRYPMLIFAIQSAGGLFLLYLAYQSVKHCNKKIAKANLDSNRSSSGFLAGFLLATLNPKVMVFFFALFSQFVKPHFLLWEQAAMAGWALMIDTLWYLFVVLSIAHFNLETYLISRSKEIAIISAGVFTFIAVGLFIDSLTSFLL